MIMKMINWYAPILDFLYVPINFDVQIRKGDLAGSGWRNGLSPYRIDTQQNAKICKILPCHISRMQKHQLDSILNSLHVNSLCGT